MKHDDREQSVDLHNEDVILCTAFLEEELAHCNVISPRLCQIKDMDEICSKDHPLDLILSPSQLTLLNSFFKSLCPFYIINDIGISAYFLSLFN